MKIARRRFNLFLVKTKKSSIRENLVAKYQFLKCCLNLRADQCFIGELYEKALSLYTAALEGSGGSAPNSAEKSRILLNRSATRIKLADYAGALVDAEESQRETLLPESHYRKGMALFFLKKYKDAHYSLTKAKEYMSSMRDPSPDHVMGSVNRWLKECSERIYEESEAPEGAPAASPAPSASTGSLKYEWYQSLTHVTFCFSCKGAIERKSHVEVSKSKLTVQLELENGSDYYGEIGLFAPVVPGEYSATYKPSRVEIRLTKEFPAQWLGAEKGAAAVPPSAASASASSGVPSAYASKKNWDSIEKAVRAEEESEQPQGEEALQKLFKQIYSNADEETRKAMNKSFQMSGGTVLSTNWKEVQERDFEKDRVAPDGMVAKKWGEE